MNDKTVMIVTGLVVVVGLIVLIMNNYNNSVKMEQRINGLHA